MHVDRRHDFYHTYLIKFVLSIFLFLFLCLPVQSKKKPAVVILAAGQSNIDGGVDICDIPQSVLLHRYQRCHWSYCNGGKYNDEGEFERFWPKGSPKKWAFDAITYFCMDLNAKRDFYVIKESRGGTALDTQRTSEDDLYWSANPEYLKIATSANHGGTSLAKGLTENIDSCIERKLSELPEGYEIKCLLWHQGENDRGSGKWYYRNMRDLIKYLRDYLVKRTGHKKYARLPVVCGTIPPSSKAYDENINNALYRLDDEDYDVHVVNMSDATLQEDGIHFDADGAKRMGVRVYNELVRLQIIEGRRIGE